MDLLNELRRLIRKSPDNAAAIAARAGLPRSALSRLLAGKTMTVEGAEKLARALGLTIELRPGKARKGK